MFSPLDYNTIDLIKQEYLHDDLPWSLGFSGGKDSSAMLKLTYNALANINSPTKPINVIYCDTGVEIPIVVSFVKRTFEALKEEVLELNLPINIKIVEPKIENRFFSKVIGRGYPTPTNKFRWCTDRLRVMPIQTFMKNKNNIVLVGVRKGESIERDKIIRKHSSDKPYYFKQANFPNSAIFAPIINYEINDIWSIIKNRQKPYSINGHDLENIYKCAGNDKIDRKKLKIPSSQEGRFGCWTCTVIRKDKAVKNLIMNGYSSLIPLLNFRDWLYNIRDEKKFRCKKRRNGLQGLGPFTLEARKLILDNLIKTQEESGHTLINDEEISFIKNQWQLDMNSPKYQED